MNKNIIKNFLFFRNCKNTDFIIKTISCFIQSIFKKETILIKEGEKVESIIFVKDGRLILEATINLLKPYESYQKYLKENFKYLKKINNDNNENVLSELDKTNNNKIYNQEENIDYLKSKLIHIVRNIKLNFNNLSNFNVNRKNSNLFQVNQNIDTEEINLDNLDDNDEKVEEEEEFQYLKILDIRKNEHFGNICMFLEKPAPLTLIVKSKIAEIFALNKKDAIMINNFHHNIMKKIYDKSYKNLLSIKKKTFQVLKKYFDLNHYKKTIIQDKSWFNEKSRDVILQDLTNFINNSILKSEKKEISATTVNFHLKDILGDNKYNHRLSVVNNSYNMLNVLNNMKNNNENNSNKDSKNFLSSKWIPKVRKSIMRGRKSFVSNLSPDYYPKITINSSEDTYRRKSLFIKNKSDNPNYNNYQNEEKENFKNNNSSLKFLNNTNNHEPKLSSKFNTLQKSNSKEISEEDSLELTIKEEMCTLNNLHDDLDKKLRKKIKTSVKRDKILKLSKIQNTLINSYQEEINSSLLIDENNNNKMLNNFKKITELNNTLYSNLIEYLETDYESENERKNNESSFNNIKKKFIIHNNINFSINSSYYNLNQLTNGRIINDENYKIDIKQLVEKYINTKKKFYLNMFKEYINFHAINKFNKGSILKKNFTKNEMDITPHNEEMSEIYNSIISEKSKIKQIRHSKTKTTNRTISKKFISNKIKKNKTNNKDIYKNFKNIDNDGKSSYLILKNNFLKRRLKTIDYGIEDDNRKNDENNNDKDSSNTLGKMIHKIFFRLKNK